MTSQEVFTALAEALRARIAVIADRALCETDPIAHLGKLKEASAHIERFESMLPSSADPQLKHFLQRCSYQKALSFLEEQGAAIR